MANKIIDCDLVVLGAAGSGLNAAVKAADVSGKKVVVLEKAKKCGGASTFASGLGDVGSVVDSDMQKNAGFDVNENKDIRGQWFDWFMTKEGTETFFTMGSNGSISEKREREEKYQNLPDPSIGPGKTGTRVVNKLVEVCEKQGIDIYTETAGKKLITKGGKIAGVLADSPDGEIQFNCKAVVLGTGGFGANDEMLSKRFPDWFNGKNIHRLCPPTITGDGITMAEEIGAAIDDKIWEKDYPGGFYTAGAVHHPYSYALHTIIWTMDVINNPQLLSVTVEGERWANEEIEDLDVGQLPEGATFLILDSKMMDELGEGLSKHGHGPGMGDGEESESEESRCMKRWREELEYEIQIDEEGAEGHHAKKADTLAELALKMNCNPTTFVNTVNRYNELCEKGEDIDFGKSAQYLQALTQPPYYAIYGHRFSQCTKGRNGVCVNPNFEAIDKNGKAIPGLYAAGDGCTIYGDLVLCKNDRDKSGAGGHGAGGAMPEGGSPGAEGGGMPSGGMMMMSAKTSSKDNEKDPYVMPKSGNILDGTASCCGGLGAAFISGYAAGMNAGKYIS